MKDRIKDYFSFSRGEQRGLTILLGLLLLSLLVNLYLPLLIPEKEFDPEPFRKQADEFLAALAEADSLANLKNDAERNKKYSAGAPGLPAFLSDPFFFDPNTADEETWKRTGLDGRTIRSILNYRQKGGVFRDKTDLKKIYTMQDTIYQLLEPYIFIKKDEKPPAPSPSQHKEKKPFPEKEKAPYVIEIIELNTADSSMLVRLPGFGPYYAERIIQYREKLGGFFDLHQLLEIKGIDSTCLAGFAGRVTADPHLILKMDLNTVTFKEMLRHPYFEYFLVKALFSHRDNVKRISSVDELRDLDIMYDELFEKIGPYLTVE
ncbi:MAG: helix-hairpin-helix domain-containing protein [Bacteroidales bacterium]|nr:helix-hairpin-helix domain-containing protein [Bacteroidales bacterium]